MIPRHRLLNLAACAYFACVFCACQPTLADENAPSASSPSATAESPPSAATPSSSGAGSSTSAAGGLAIVAQTAKSSYPAFEPITLNVILRNTGLRSASLGGSAFDISCFHFVVTNPASKPLSLSPFGKRQMAIPTRVLKNTPIALDSGYQRVYGFDLTRMYNLTVPGMYTVVAKRTVIVSRARPGTSHMVAVALSLVSDPVAFTVVAAPPSPAPQNPSDQTQLPEASTVKWMFAFVRGGDIWVADGDGINQRMIIEDADAPSWSPDKSLIAFARHGDVWVADWRGENQKRLTSTGSLEAGVNPVFSPDGKWIAYRTYTEGDGIEIRLVSIDGRDDKPFVDDGEEPAW